MILAFCNLQSTISSRSNAFIYLVYYNYSVVAFLKVLNNLVLSLVNGEVNRKVFMPSLILESLGRG